MTPLEDYYNFLNEAKILNTVNGEYYTKKEINDTIKTYKGFLKSTEDSLKFSLGEIKNIDAGNSIYANSEKSKKDYEEMNIVTQKTIENFKKTISDWEKFRDTGEVPVKN